MVTITRLFSLLACVCVRVCVCVSVCLCNERSCPFAGSLGIQVHFPTERTVAEELPVALSLSLPFARSSAPSSIVENKLRISLSDPCN